MTKYVRYRERPCISFPGSRVLDLMHDPMDAKGSNGKKPVQRDFLLIGCLILGSVSWNKYWQFDYYYLFYFFIRKFDWFVIFFFFSFFQVERDEKLCLLYSKEFIVFRITYFLVQFIFIVCRRSEICKWYFFPFFFLFYVFAYGNQYYLEKRICRQVLISEYLIFHYTLSRKWMGATFGLVSVYLRMFML